MNRLSDTVDLQGMDRDQLIGLLNALYELLQQRQLSAPAFTFTPQQRPLPCPVGPYTPNYPMFPFGPVGYNSTEQSQSKLEHFVSKLLCNDSGEIKNVGQKQAAELQSGTGTQPSRT